MEPKVIFVLFLVSITILIVGASFGHSWLNLLMLASQTVSSQISREYGSISNTVGGRAVAGYRGERGRIDVPEGIEPPDSWSRYIVELWGRLLLIIIILVLGSAQLISTFMKILNKEESSRITIVEIKNRAIKSLPIVVLTISTLAILPVLSRYTRTGERKGVSAIKDRESKVVLKLQSLSRALPSNVKNRITGVIGHSSSTPSSYNFGNMSGADKVKAVAAASILIHLYTIIPEKNRETVDVSGLVDDPTSLIIELPRSYSGLTVPNFHVIYKQNQLNDSEIEAVADILTSVNIQLSELRKAYRELEDTIGKRSMLEAVTVSAIIPSFYFVLKKNQM